MRGKADRRCFSREEKGPCGVGGLGEGTQKAVADNGNFQAASEQRQRL